ncbi:MAG: radical SAM/SPASM domain-containing protein, partial [Geoalkalibacter sp.]|uniref:radical SAM protein n=1 Tax=Geoalkalibacter sp. TaxID=3041440 RepID=UPI003D0C443F
PTPHPHQATHDKPHDTQRQHTEHAHHQAKNEYDKQGGELLDNPEKLFKFIEAIKPERYYLYLTTNGYFLDEKMAKRLAEAGVDRVSVSIDSMNPERHDEFRGKKGAHKHAMAALEHVKNAGMTPYLNITVGHFNALSDDIKQLCAYSEEKGYITLLNIAVPSGCWQGDTKVMVDEKDMEELMRLRKKHGNIIRDAWNSFDRKHEGILGCNCVNRTYITPTGDVLVCPYLHIKIGNIYEQTLTEIVEYGFSIPQFRDHSDKCLAGEDKDFVNCYMQQEMSIFGPLDAHKLFPRDD